MSQESNNGTVRIFSVRACAEPLEKAAQLFEAQTGIHVEIDVCNRHCASAVAEEATADSSHDDFLVEISDAFCEDCFRRCGQSF